MRCVTSVNHYGVLTTCYRSKPNPINPLVLLSLNQHCSQNEGAEGEEKELQDEVHVSLLITGVNPGN